MAVVTVSTKYGLRNVHAVQLESMRGGRILVLIEPHDIPSGVEMMNGKLLKKAVRFEQGTVLHRTRRHVKPGDWPRFDVMQYGLMDLISRLTRVKLVEDVAETKVVRATLPALAAAFQRTLRYKVLKPEERIQLVKLEHDVMQNIQSAVAEYKVEMRKHLRHASSILDGQSPQRVNPGKTRAAITAAKRNMHCRGKEVLAISHYIAADVIACESEVERILREVYEPILDMAVSWIDFHRLKDVGGIKQKHIVAICAGLDVARGELATVRVAPYVRVARMLAAEMKELMEVTDSRKMAKGLKKIRARILGERAKARLLMVNVELGYLERAKHLSAEEYEQRLRAAVFQLKQHSNAVVRRTGDLRDAARELRRQLLKLTYGIESPEFRKDLKRLRQPIKQLAEMVNP